MSQKLNIGCGQYRADGWVNIDINTSDVIKPDLQAALPTIPLPDGCASHIYLGHVLEHLALADVPAALAEVTRLAAPGARIMVVGPDLDRAVGQYAYARSDILTGPVTRPNARPGEAHLWECTETLTLTHLVAARFHATPISITDVDATVWPIVSKIGWQFAIEAVPKRRYTRRGAAG